MSTNPTNQKRRDIRPAARAGEAARRARHGLGSSDCFPGNVSHLVNPIVGALRLMERDGEALSATDMEWYIDRLSLVLALAESEPAESELAVLRAKLARVEALADGWERYAEKPLDVQVSCLSAHVAAATRVREALADPAPGAEGDDARRWRARCGCYGGPHGGYTCQACR